MLARVLENLEQVRTQRGLPGYRLSLKLGKPKNYWSKIYTQEIRMTLEGYVEIARALDVSPSKLLRESLNSNIEDNSL